jgi:ATP-dependent Clp protease protease subunit
MRNRLLQLLADNRRAYAPMQQRIVMATGADGTEATVYLYDAIVGDRLTAEWWGGICPQDFVPAFRAIRADKIRLYINSPGGDVFACEAMCQALREHSAHVTAQIEGLAASAATSIACAADEVVITPGSMYMIHKAWTLAIGNADDMRAMADLLDKCDGTMISEYVHRSGNDTQRVTDWCTTETWFTAQEAVDAGFADSLVEPVKPAATAQARATWNLRAYERAPAATVQPAPPMPEAKPEQDQNAQHRATQQRSVKLLSARKIV